MLAVLLLLVLLVFLFGGLGMFVAKVFLFAAAVALILSIVTGGIQIGRR